MKSQLFSALGGLALATVFAASPATAIVVFTESFDLPLPGSVMAGPSGFVQINDPSPGWQVQGGGGTDATHLGVSLTAGVDEMGIGGTQALFANWDHSGAVNFTFNQYTVYGVPGPATVNEGVAVPNNLVEVSMDLFVSGYENEAVQLEIDYQSVGAMATNSSVFFASVTNDAYTHVTFTLDQSNNPGVVDTTVPFNLRVQHGAGGFGFDADNILRLDNVLVQTLEAQIVPGDYNENGAVDAADYTVWRDHLGQEFQLPNEDPANMDGMVTQSDYEFWVANFGTTGGGGAGSLAVASVPEPASLVLAVAVGGAFIGIRRTRQTGARMDGWQRD